MPEFPAITIWQPWATLIAVGAKPFEFRSWAPAKAMWGQRIAIHAGARPVKLAEVKELLLRLHSDDWSQTTLLRQPAIELLERVLMTRGDLPRSCIVCTATMGRPIRDAELEERLGLASVNDSDRDGHTNYGWPLSQIRQITPPEPATGRQGWWTWRTSNPDA